VHETREDIERLQALLDESHASAGEHLRSIFADERRVDAADLPARLSGVQVVHLATVTAKGEPRVAPVDGLLYRAELYFGTSPRSLRARHLRARPQLSASIAHGEQFALVVHGRAVEIDMDADEQAPLRAFFTETYGEIWESFRQGNPYWRIEPQKLFTFGGWGSEPPA
jgi:nitroimidazol reductase NimA-like FMN-containing flavoprotein (pyridoxamine 5'-phosphate oxidase superfamily)